MPFASYVREAICEPLGVDLDPDGHPGVGHARERSRTSSQVGRELLVPTLVAPETLDEMTSVQFPGLDGVLPDYGRFDPLDWGLGVELKGRKSPHWIGVANLAEHVRPLRRLRDVPLGRPRGGPRLAALTTREFGDWAKEAWPRLSDAVLAEAAGDTSGV